MSEKDVVLVGAEMLRMRSVRGKEYEILCVASGDKEILAQISLENHWARICPPESIRPVEEIESEEDGLSRPFTLRDLILFRDFILEAGQTDLDLMARIEASKRLSDHVKHEVRAYLRCWQEPLLPD